MKSLLQKATILITLVLLTFVYTAQIASAIVVPINITLSAYVLPDSGIQRMLESNSTQIENAVKINNETLSKNPKLNQLLNGALSLRDSMFGTSYSIDVNPLELKSTLSFANETNFIKGISLKQKDLGIGEEIIIETSHIYAVSNGIYYNIMLTKILPA